MSLLEQDTTRKERVDKNAMTQLEFEVDNNQEYKVEEIWDSTVYAIELEAGYLPGLYYLVDWKSYAEEESTWEPASAVQHHRKLLSKFYWENSTKPIVTSPLVNSAPPMARSTIKPTGTTKQKRGRPTKNSTNKRAKKT